ncbi:MAG: NUDIX domain-containing protein [Myxococcota bacterium]
MSTPQIQVALVVLYRVEDQTCLLTYRAQHLHAGGCWEFPGGKIEPDESPKEAAQRELFEETQLDACTLQHWKTFSHNYSDRTVHLHVFLAKTHPKQFDFQHLQHKWISIPELQKQPEQIVEGSRAWLPLLPETFPQKSA